MAARPWASLFGTGGAINLDNGSLTVDQATTSFFAGSIGGAGGLTKAGAGFLSLTGANTYTGDTTVNAGTLQLGPGGSLASTTALIVNGGGFEILNGSGQTVGSLAGTGGGVLLGDGSLTVDQAATTSFAGVINGGGGLTKTGAGLLSLTGFNSYSGGTTVDAGTLRLGQRRLPEPDRRAHRQWRQLRSRERLARSWALSPAPAAPSPWAMAASP